MSANSIPTIPLGGEQISRLIIGGNPFSGNSHVSSELDSQMEDFFTTAEIKKTLTRCKENGINTMQLRADKHIMRIIRELRLEGLHMHWIAQTASEVSSFEGNIRQIMRYDPVAIYHHGTLTDALWDSGRLDELHARLGIMRATGKPVGLCTHIPEVIETSEAEGWDVDFYMACVYNLSKKTRISSAVTGIANEEEPFDLEDIEIMYRTIRNTQKTCLAFKILGATRRCGTEAEVENCFKEAYENIKPCDAVIVGMYPNGRDEVLMNAGYAKKYA